MIREERHHGAIIIDIGASLTSIGVYLKDNLVFSNIIKVGGIHITSDLVKGLGTEAEEAEKTQEDVFTTRLKLAEAYLEMGDRDGAVDMLQEVIADGSPDQQDIARRIMDRIENGDD